MRQHADAELDVQRIAAACAQRLIERCPRDRNLVARTLARLTPAKWTLEWYLPWWLAASFGLDCEPAEELVQSNVLGLIAVRLEDDLLDGDVRAPDLDAARRLSAAALDEALHVYRRNFPGSSAFWPFLGRTLMAWRRASSRAAGPDEGPDGLASLGSPLKVGAYAICLRADRSDAWPSLERCLDHALSALVRYDQISDWESDLAAGRRNAFVAAVAGPPQRAVPRREGQVATLVALLATHAARDEFDRIAADARSAARIAASLGCQPLGAFLTRYADEATSEGASIERHYQDVARRATSLIFGNAPGLAS